MSGQGLKAQAVAWIDGRWGTPAELAVPLQDRGLLLADGLFETVLVQAGRPVLLEAHLQRWCASAALLAMDPPPGAAQLEPLIREAIERAGLSSKDADASADVADDCQRHHNPGLGPCGALRLNWSRGDANGRGIDLVQGSAWDHRQRFWLQLSPWSPTFSAQTAHISRLERRNGFSRLSQCKTFAYGQAIQARHEARLAGADEALLLSTRGTLCCGAVANLMVRCGERWLTPPLSSGCLPGVMRGRAVALGLAEEADMTWDRHAGLRVMDPATGAEVPDLQPSAWVLLNSLSCRPLSAINEKPLPQISAAAAETFWRQLH